MNTPTITTIDGVKHEMKPINGRAYRIVAEFDNTVRQIMRRDFEHCAKRAKQCENCDFRYRCAKK